MRRLLKSSGVQNKRKCRGYQNHYIISSISDKSTNMRASLGMQIYLPQVENVLLRNSSSCSTKLWVRQIFPKCDL